MTRLIAFAALALLAACGESRAQPGQGRGGRPCFGDVFASGANAVHSGPSEPEIWLTYALRALDSLRGPAKSRVRRIG